MDVEASDTALLSHLELAVDKIIKKLVAPLEKRIGLLEGITVRNTAVQIIEVLCRQKSMRETKSQKYSDADGYTMERIKKCANVLGIKRHQLCSYADKIVKDRDSHQNNQKELDEMVKRTQDLIDEMKSRERKQLKNEIDIITKYKELKESM